MANNKNNAKLPDIQTLFQAGIDPKTGLPLKMGNTGEMLKGNIKKVLRIIDEQDAVSSFTWYNLPNGLDSELMERILYYKGQGAFFYMKDYDKFFFLPYALDGTIDIYGRYTGITPLPFTGNSDNGQEGKKVKAWIDGLKFKPLYEFPDVESADEFLKLQDEGCILLADYTKQISQNVISRQMLNDPLIDVEADLIPFMRTALLSSTGVAGMRVTSQDEYSNVLAASHSIDHAALTGEKYIPVIGGIEFQELAGGQVARADEFLISMQALDNFRLNTHGISNGGIFQKKAQVLQSEQNMADSGAGSVLQSRLYQRQRFCDLVNALWGLGISCEPSEFAINADMNADGIVDNEQDQSGTLEGEQDQSLTASNGGENV